MRLQFFFFYLQQTNSFTAKGAVFQMLRIIQLLSQSGVALACILLYTTLYAQHPYIRFDTTHYDLGAVLEDKGPVKCRFLFKNTGSGFLRIVDVKASCGCSTPLFLSESVAPGQAGYVEIAFDPRGRPGPFTKSATVYSNAANKEVVLTFSGTVIERFKKSEFEFQHKGVALYSTLLDLGILSPTKSDTMYFSIKNTSNKRLRVSKVIHNSGYFLAKMADEEIPPLQTGVLQIITKKDSLPKAAFFEDELTLMFKRPGPKKLKLQVTGQVKPVP